MVINYISNKGLGPVVALALLILVGVVGVVSFESFYDSYQQSLLNKVEKGSSNNVILNIQLVESGSSLTKIYVQNPSNSYSIISEIKLNKNGCNLLSSDVLGENSVTILEVDCLILKNSDVEVLLISDFGIFEETHFSR